ncbi:securin isoform X1 [Pipra filicauda]|uniref:Securin n=1 Tax=Pipra filicauda TaxID=649802 RepID=A0A6J2IU58_9PASS|nr:securin isoform X1 [Pipra filicauda]
MASLISVGADNVAPESQLLISPGSSKGKSTHSGGVVCTPLHKKAFSPAAMTCSRRKALGKKAITTSAAMSHSGGKGFGKKVNTVPEGTYQPLRRALGKVNTTTGVMSKMPEVKQENQPQMKQENQPQMKQENQPQMKQENQPQMKQENQPHTANKTDEKTELDSWTSESDEDLVECKEEDWAESQEDWPEVENMFPFDPQDFEVFDVPEECKLSNLDLRGVPLMVYPRTYHRCVEEEPAPLPTPELSFTPSLLQAHFDFIASLEKLHFPELPPFPADFYEEQECCNRF